MTSWKDILHLKDKEVLDLLDVYKRYVIHMKRSGEGDPEDFVTFVEQQLFRPFMRYECTEWTCENCGKSGTVNHKTDAGVWEVLYMIEDDHRSISPGCFFNRQAIRVKLGIRL